MGDLPAEINSTIFSRRIKYGQVELPIFFGVKTVLANHNTFTTNHWLIYMGLSILYVNICCAIVGYEYIYIHYFMYIYILK